MSQSQGAYQIKHRHRIQPLCIKEVNQKEHEMDEIQN